MLFVVAFAYIFDFMLRVLFTVFLPAIGGVLPTPTPTSSLLLLLPAPFTALNFCFCVWQPFLPSHCCSLFAVIDSLRVVCKPRALLLSLSFVFVAFQSSRSTKTVRYTIYVLVC